MFLLLFFFNDTATTEIYTLSLHDALPILSEYGLRRVEDRTQGESTSIRLPQDPGAADALPLRPRSEEHTSELQSHLNLVCRLLLEKKKNNKGKNLQNKSTQLQAKH